MAEFTSSASILVVLLFRWQNLGPQYVGEFMCVFLSSRCKRMQAVGLYGLRVVIDNLHL